MGKAVSKGKGISLCRYGGLNIVKQRGNYGNDTFHSAPERYGFYAFPYSFVEMFLVGSTKTKEVKKIRIRSLELLMVISGHTLNQLVRLILLLKKALGIKSL